MMSIRLAVTAGLAFLAGGIAGGIATEAAAQGVPSHFRGNACIINASAACNPSGFGVGACAAARFSPPRWNGNPNNTRLSLFWGYYAQNYSANGTLVGARMRPVQTGGIGNSFSSHNRSTARIAAQAPAAPAAGAVYLTNTMVVSRFEDVPGCTVTLRFQGQRYPLP